MTQDNFIKRVFPEPNTGCWIWAGREIFKGYGGVHIPKNGPKIQLAHRLSYWFFKGEFDLKKHVLHHCDNSFCVNPDHLYLGDQRQNNLDRDRRGRHKTTRGSNHKLSKITEQDSIDIRKLHIVDGLKQRQIAKIYGISQRKVLDIVKNRSWKHTL